ncbi:nucleolar and coiled-body phosphoprotein 1-like isoform X2 [Littorina saxatilis]
MEGRSSDNPIQASKWKLVKQSILDKKIMREGIQHCECSENCNENNAPTEDTTSEQKLENKTCQPPPLQKKKTSPTENDEEHPTNDESIEGSTVEVSAEPRLKAPGSGCTDSEAPPQVTAALLIPRQEETEPRKETKPAVEHDEVSGKVSGNLDKLKNFVTQGKQRLNSLFYTVSHRFRRHRDPSAPSRNALPCESEWKAEREGCRDSGSGSDFLNSFEEHVPENLSPAAAASVPCETSAATSPGQPSVEDPAPESHKETDQVDDGPRNSTEKYPCENTDSSGVETCDDAPPDEATSSQNVTEKPDEGEDFQIAAPDTSSSSQNCTVNQENEGEDLEASVQELQVTDAGTIQHRRAVENVDETVDKEDGAQRGEKEPSSISSTAAFGQVGAKNGLSPTNRNPPSDQEDAAGNKATSRQRGKEEQAAGGFSEQPCLRQEKEHVTDVAIEADECSKEAQNSVDAQLHEKYLNQGTNCHVPDLDTNKGYEPRQNLPQLRIMESEFNHETTQDVCEPTASKGSLNHDAIQSSSARNDHELGLEDERSLTTPTGNDDERELNHDQQPEVAESTTHEPYSIDETNQSVSPRNNSEPYPSHETERVVAVVSVTETTLNNDTNQDATTRINSRQNLNQDRNQASVYHAINESHASNEIPNSNIEPNQGSAEQSNSEQGLNNGTEQGFQVQNYDDSLLNQEIHHDTQGNQNEPPDIVNAGNPESQQEDNNLPAQEPGWNHGPREAYQPTVIGVRLRQPTAHSGTTRELESVAGASAQQTVRSRSVEMVDLRNGQRVHDRQHDAVQRTGCLREVLELVRLPRPAPPSTNDSSMPAQQSENPGDSSLLQLITRFRSQLSPRGHQMCLHCDERPPDTILLNCHHCVFCRACARLASYCPLPGCDVATLGFIFLH